MTARGKVVATLNAWEWPASLDGFTWKERQTIIKAAFDVAAGIVPHEEWIKAWRQRPEVKRLLVAQPGREGE